MITNSSHNSALSSDWHICWLNDACYTQPVRTSSRFSTASAILMQLRWMRHVVAHIIRRLTGVRGARKGGPAESALSNASTAPVAALSTQNVETLEAGPAHNQLPDSEQSDADYHSPGGSAEQVTEAVPPMDVQPAMMHLPKSEWLWLLLNLRVIAKDPARALQSDAIQALLDTLDERSAQWGD
jgi:hypothetical protein